MSLTPETKALERQAARLEDPEAHWGLADRGSLAHIIRGHIAALDEAQQERDEIESVKDGLISENGSHVAEIIRLQQELDLARRQADTLADALDELTAALARMTGRYVLSPNAKHAGALARDALAGYRGQREERG